MRVTKTVSHKIEERKGEDLDTPLRTLALSHHRNAQPAIRRLQDELLMPPRADEVGNALDENEPANNHQRVRQPIARADFRRGGRHARSVAALA